MIFYIFQQITSFKNSEYVIALQQGITGIKVNILYVYVMYWHLLFDFKVIS
jgi:hypothetical protein